jgi:ADP-ribosyl-[dinitrogen reductase] hydrolase
MKLESRLLGGLWGSLVGDALGVPVEFRTRDDILLDPVTDMREFGTHNQPKGTWSDDGGLLLCTADSLANHEFDSADMGQRFLSWYNDGLWTAHGDVFDIGITTSRALELIAQGVPAESAGGSEPNSNGNGSLMRILPVALRFATRPTNELLNRIHRASAITHRHPRSQMACGFHALVVRDILNGASAAVALKHARATFKSYYEMADIWVAQMNYFYAILQSDLPASPEGHIASGGYVMETLTASLWSLLTTENFQQCVLKAVNLGGDTDTTGCVAGGLAGLLYGFEAIPIEWRATLPRQKDLDELFQRFTRLIESR